MPSADQVPIKTAHSKMLWPKWVVLIAGSTGTALRAVRPPNRYVTPGCPARDRLGRKRGRFLVALAPGHHCPGHPCELVGERDGSDLGRSSRQQSCEPRPMAGTMDLGVAGYGECASREQATQVAVALLADAAQPVLAPARVLLRHEPDPSREVPRRSKGLGIGYARH